MRSTDTFQLLLIAGLLVFTSACGGGDSASESSDGSSAAAPAADTTPMGTATVTGSVTFSGTAPAPAAINLNRECRALNSDGVMAQSVVVNDNGTLQNVFVYVSEGLGEYSYATPAEAVEFDQSGCMYAPHVFGVMAGQAINIKNSDPLMHNIHALPETNRPFNFGMPIQGSEMERNFRVPEVMVFIKCDVHPWMGAYAGVLDHPYYSVSGNDGSFSIGHLPAGDYVISAWHEEYGTTTQTVTVGDGESQAVSFDFGSGA